MEKLEIEAILDRIRFDRDEVIDFVRSNSCQFYWRELKQIVIYKNSVDFWISINRFALASKSVAKLRRYVKDVLNAHTIYQNNVDAVIDLNYIEDDYSNHLINF